MASKALLDLLFEERSLVHELDILNGEWNELRTADVDLSIRREIVDDKLKEVRMEIRVYLDKLKEV